MIELYHCVDARSFRVLWALEEMGLSYRLHILPFPPRLLQPDYLKKNPLGTIPLMIDGEVRMTESAAIPQYLVTRYGPTPLAVGVDETRALGDREWLCAGRFTMADLSVGYALLFARVLNLEHKFSPEIAAYWDRLSARPGFVAAKTAELSR
jgi:glutathione S-transferase